MWQLFLSKYVKTFSILYFMRHLFRILFVHASFFGVFRLIVKFILVYMMLDTTSLLVFKTQFGHGFNCMIRLIVPIPSLLQHLVVDFIAKIRQIDTLSPNVSIFCICSMQPMLLQSGCELLMKKRSSQLIGEGIAPKPKKMVG
ncbi:uncharacterized protein LOC131304288 [Rhododendron vialii]|uniref:uncharacterized protein LOC131304288 n=1 Tax=Rhododendron vialii TaxID=182163 RepID=UPI00265EC448|nr:uncharacterized protein LOC131304288 [Rhododendron vialii]